MPDNNYTPAKSIANESMHLILVDDKIREELRSIVFDAMTALIESELNAVLDANFETTFEKALGIVLQRHLAATIQRKIAEHK